MLNKTLFQMFIQMAVEKAEKAFYFLLTLVFWVMLFVAGFFFVHGNANAQIVFDEDQIPVITNAKLADMTADTIKMRNNAVNGDPLDTKISELTEEATPAVGDWLLCEDSLGSLKKCDVGDLPTGGGGINNIVEDLTPQLGGDLELNGNNITGSGDITTTGTLNVGTSPVSLDTVNIDGSVSLTHTSAETGDHALEIDLNAAALGDNKAIDIVYTTGVISTGDDEAVILVNVDETAATGGDIVGLEVVATEGGADKITVVAASAGVGIIEQLSGVFIDADTVLNNAIDVTTALADGGAGNISVFVSDNDTVTIGSVGKFEEIELILGAAASGSGVAPTFEFSTGVGTWSSFTPIDGTNGLRNTGVVVWFEGDIPTWATGTGGEYLIRITRTRNALSTTPVADKIQVVAATEYYWDKNGDLVVNSVTVSGGEVVSKVETPVDNQLGVWTGDGTLEGTSSLVFDGNLGIGTSTPEESVHIKGSGNPRLEVEGTDSSVSLSLRNSVLTPAANTEIGRLIFNANNSAGTEVNYSQIRGFVLEDVAGAHDGYLSFYTTNNAAISEKVRISESGAVGIGTTAPSVDLKLDVAGKVGATEYCDDAGANCIAPADIQASTYDLLKKEGTGTQVLTGFSTELQFATSLIDLGSHITDFSSQFINIETDGVYKLGAFITASSPDQRAQFACRWTINNVDEPLRGSAYIRNTGTSWDYWILEMAPEPFELVDGDFVELECCETSGASLACTANTTTTTVDRAESRVWVERVN